MKFSTWNLNSIKLKRNITKSSFERKIANITRVNLKVQLDLRSLFIDRVQLLWNCFRNRSNCIWPTVVTITRFSSKLGKKPRIYINVIATLNPFPPEQDVTWLWNVFYITMSHSTRKIHKISDTTCEGVTTFNLKGWRLLTL